MSQEANGIANQLSALIPEFLNLGGQGHPEAYLEERLYAAEYINDPQIPNFSLARCRVEPGVTTQLHRLSVDEWYVIESGEGRMQLGDLEKIVAPGSIVQIPRDVPQRVCNIGDQDLVFFCVCTPRFTPETYTSDE